MDKVFFSKITDLNYSSKEAYNTLRTNIQFCGNEIKAITITSSIAGEGKSTVSFNLATSFAEDGKKVILLDADLRKSVLIGRYKIQSIEAGLTNYLVGQKKIPEIIYNTNINNMDIIFSGSNAPNPSELLDSIYFTKLIEQLRADYDYIVIDAPPLGLVIDSAIIAAKSDGAVLVIEEKAISYRILRDVKNQLEKSNCKILGTVLNKVHMEDKKYYKKKFGKNYKKHYEKYYTKKTK